MKWYKNSLVWFVVLFVLSLGIIFFVKKEFNPQTNTSSFTIWSDAWKHFRKGMDIAWWVKLTYKIDFSKYDQIYTDAAEREIAKRSAMDIILQNIDKRVSALGVSDYQALPKKIGSDYYIAVEIGWVYSLDAAKEIIGKTVELEFKVSADTAPNQKELVAQKASQAKTLFAAIKADPANVAQLVMGKESDDVYAQYFSWVNIDNLPLVYQNNRAKLLKAKKWDVLDFGLGVYMKAEPTAFATTGETSVRWYSLTIVDDVVKTETATGVVTLVSATDIFVSEKPSRITAVDAKTNKVLNGAFFRSAGVTPWQTGRPVVTINFNDEGKEIFCNLSTAHVGKQMAIFVWWQLLTAPNINEPICGWSAQIDGQFTTASAKELADWLNEGALPAPLILSQEEKVSALLGENALLGAGYATIISLILIFIMLFIMYERRLALVGVIVLLSYAVFLLAAFKMIDYALSLSGIAAIILSLWMGIDANILMFEKFKEERLSGKSWLASVDVAHDRSYTAIFDGNATTFLIFVILFLMGMSIFKGFGFAGMITSLLIIIVNVPLTRKILDQMKK